MRAVQHSFIIGSSQFSGNSDERRGFIHPFGATQAWGAAARAIALPASSLAARGSRQQRTPCKARLSRPIRFIKKHLIVVLPLLLREFGFVFADRFRQKIGPGSLLSSRQVKRELEIFTIKDCGTPIVPSKTARPKNALAHGLYASDLVLAWESEQDFVDLHESIRQELNRVGSLEDITVLDITRLHWVKRRLNRQVLSWR
jgi:hypothetical protein